MTIFQAAFLGMIQGITEFLPVSSSGHLVIFQHLFALSTPPVMFDIEVHASTLLVVLVFFRHQLKRLTFSTLKSILLATIPVVILGMSLNSHTSLLFDSLNLVGLGLLVSSLFLFSTKHTVSTKPATTPNQPISIRQALLIGLSQASAIIPGVSRSGSTISTGLKLKLSRQTAFEFAFLLSIPSILGALVLQLLTLDTSVPIDYLPLIIGFLTAAPTGLLALTLLKRTLLKQKLYYFGFYCLGLSMLTLLLPLVAF